MSALALVQFSYCVPRDPHKPSFAFSVLRGAGNPHATDWEVCTQFCQPTINLNLTLREAPRTLQAADTLEFPTRDWRNNLCPFEGARPTSCPCPKRPTSGSAHLFEMDDFVSESDSDYTSYWRDWVSILQSVLSWKACEVRGLERIIHTLALISPVPFFFFSVISSQGDAISSCSSRGANSVFPPSSSRLAETNTFVKSTKTI